MTITCPRCNGMGQIRGVESTALHILRIIQEEAMKENSAAVHAQVPVDVATFLLNEKRTDIRSIEARLKVNVILIPNIHLETPNYKVERLRHDDLNQEGVLPASYELVEAPAEEERKLGVPAEKPQRMEAAVKGITPDQPAPVFTPPPAPTQGAPVQPAAPYVPQPAPIVSERPSLIDRIFGWFRNKSAPTGLPPALPAPAQPQSTVAGDASAPRPAEARGPRPEREARGGERRDRGDGRRDRGERRDGREGRRDGRPERGQRGERGDRGERRGEARPEGSVAPPQRERHPGPQRERHERGARHHSADAPPAPAEAFAFPVSPVSEVLEPVEAPGLTGVLPGEGAVVEGPERERRRRRRRGRGGRDGEGQRAGGDGEGLEPVEAQEVLEPVGFRPPAAAFPFPVSAEPAREHRERREPREPREPRPPREAREPRERREPREPREKREPREPREVREPREPRERSAPATIELSVDTPEPLPPVPAAVTAEPRLEPATASLESREVTAPPPSVPVVDVEEALKQSGLVMVQTDPNRATAPPDLATELAPAPRARRERKPAASKVDEPLVQVETRRE
jgi:ribonuclease E